LEAQNQSATSRPGTPDARRLPGFRLEVDTKINTKRCGAGATVDISEFGVSALLKLEVPLGEFVELQFMLPYGPVTVYAVVRQRSAFWVVSQFGFDKSPIGLGGPPTVQLACP
jgi:hypothetical protein